MDQGALQKILDNSVLQNFEAGRIVVQQGDMPANIYFILEGSVRTLRANVEGDEATIRMLKPGDTCMEAVLFMGIPSPIVVQAVDDAKMIMINGNFIKKFIKENNQLASNLLEIVTHYYKAAMHQIEGMAIKSPLQRVGYYFLQKHIEQGSNNTEFELPFKKSIIANHLGITPETFSRTLTQIKKMGIEVEGRHIHMKDIFALCQFCDIDAAHQCTALNKKDCVHCPMHTENCN